jgi:hypothetical protein
MGGYHGTKIKGKGWGGGCVFQKMECPLEWVFYFLQCDPNKGGKKKEKLTWPPITLQKSENIFTMI